MKTTEEMIEVMQAYVDGKKIECKCTNMPCAGWFTTEKPAWGWSFNDYRVKPEPHYVPYDSVMEVDRDKWVNLKGSNILRRIEQIESTRNNVCVGRWMTLADLFENFVYEDGSPCGKLVEE